MPYKIITTVLASAKSYEFTDLATVKAELELTDGKSDARLKRYIKAASAAAAQYCNRRGFQIETVQDAIFPQKDPHLPGSFETLQLSSWPIGAIVSLTENGNTLVVDIDFSVDADVGQLIRLDMAGNRCLWNALPKVAQFTAGFSGRDGFGGIPADIEDAVIKMVTRRYLAPKDPNLMQQTVPGVLEQRWWIASNSETGNMSPDITDVLDNYRVPVVA